MDVRIVGHRGAPTVQNASQAHLRAHPFGVGGDGLDRFGGSLEQQAIHRLFVPTGDPRDLGRQGEDHMERIHRQQVLGSRIHPIAFGWSLTLGAVLVLATVVDDVMVATPDPSSAFLFGSHRNCRRFLTAKQHAAILNNFSTTCRCCTSRWNGGIMNTKPMNYEMSIEVNKAQNPLPLSRTVRLAKGTAKQEKGRIDKRIILSRAQCT